MLWYVKYMDRTPSCTDSLSLALYRIHHNYDSCFTEDCLYNRQDMDGAQLRLKNKERWIYNEDRWIYSEKRWIYSVTVILYGCSGLSSLASHAQQRTPLCNRNACHLIATRWDPLYSFTHSAVRGFLLVIQDNCNTLYSFTSFLSSYPIHPIVPVWTWSLPISLWDLYGGLNTRRYTIAHGFCFFKLFPTVCIGLILGYSVVYFVSCMALCFVLCLLHVMFTCEDFQGKTRPAILKLTHIDTASSKHMSGQ